MAFFNDSQTQVAYVPETVLGTIPTNPAWNIIPVSDFDLGVAKDILNDPSIYGDRMQRYQKHGNRKVDGSFTAPLLGNIATTGNMSFDPLFEAVLGGTWTTNVLKVGNSINRSFTVEKKVTDQAGVAKYIRWKGVKPTGFSLEVNSKDMIKVKYDLLGIDQDSSYTIVGGTPTYTSVVSTLKPMVHFNAGTSTYMTGNSGSLAASTIISNVKLNVKQASAPLYALGSSIAAGFSSDALDINGSITAYFVDTVLLTAFLNETDQGLSMVVGDGTRSLTILLPRLVFTDAKITTDGTGASTVEIPFTSVYDSANASNIVITRA